MFNVLLIDSGTQGLAIAKSLFKAGHKIILLHKGEHNYADDSKYVSLKYRYDFTTESNQFLELVITIIENEKIDAVIPMSDNAAVFLSKKKHIINKQSRFLIPDYKDFVKGYDKNQLMKLCQEKGYPHPYTISVGRYIEEIDKDTIEFPLLIKPNQTSGGRGMTLINSYDELLAKYPNIYKTYGDCHLQKFIQEGGRQLKVQVYITNDGKMLNSSVIDKRRWYPVNGGSSCCAVSIKDENLVDVCYRILKDINWIGFADFDLIEDPSDGVFKIMEINPRVPACIKLPIIAGVDWGQIILNDYMGLTSEETNYKSGVVLRHLGLDVLWFINSPKRFKTRPNWFNFIGSKIGYQDFDISDINPFFKGTYQNIKKLRNPSFKESKKGMAR